MTGQKTAGRPAALLAKWVWMKLAKSTAETPRNPTSTIVEIVDSRPRYPINEIDEHSAIN